MRRHDHGLGAIAVDEDLAQVSGVGLVATGVEGGDAAAADVGGRIDHVTAGSERATFVVYGVAEGIDGLAEVDYARGLEGGELAEERDPAVEARELVVLDDVARLALLLEVILDEGLGLEGEGVVDGRGDEVDGTRGAAGLVARERLDACAREAELELGLDEVRSTPGAAGKEERVIAPLDHHRRVGLEDLLVEHRLHAPVDAVRAEVVHEEADDRVRKEVLAGAVDDRRELRALERVAEDQRIQIRGVGRDEDERALPREGQQLLVGPLDRQQILQSLVGGDDLPRELGGAHHRRDQSWDEVLRHGVDARVEVPSDVGGHPHADPVDRAALLLVGHSRDAAEDSAPVAEVLLRLFVPLLGEALRLVEGDLVQRQLHGRAIRRMRLGHALGHLANDVLALLVEPEDRRVVLLRRIGPQAGQPQRLVREEFHTPSKYRASSQSVTAFRYSRDSQSRVRV